MRNETNWLRLKVSLCLIFSLCCLPAQSQEQVTAITQTANVLTQLRDDEVENALSLLGQAVDSGESPRNLSAASAGIYRALAQLSSDERYDLLRKWVLPTPERKNVRLLTTLVPEIAPPQEFARALGERPQEESFQIASVGKMPGLFDAGWTMIVAADESGAMSRLLAELEKLAADSTPGADKLLNLARIRDGRTDIDELKALVTARIAADAQGEYRFDAVLVAAAVERDELGEAAEKIVNRLNNFSFETAVAGEVEDLLPHDSVGISAFTSFLRRLRAHVILQNRSPETSPKELFYTVPKLWVSAGDQTARTGSTGSDEAIWLTHEDHVKRLTGPGEDLLLFRYPLSGKFELKGEIAQLEHGGGGLTFGGMSFDANDKRFRLKEVQREFFVDRTWPFVAPIEFRMFNRVNLRSDGQKIIFLSNLHPGWTGTARASSTAPWLGLRAFGRGRMIFRNLELVGQPKIPDEVVLLGDDLRGWNSRYGESSPRVVVPFAFNGEQNLPAVENPVWSVVDGVIQGANDPATGDVLQSHLGYMRPVQNGETVSYEFFYEEDKTVVHPTLGRVAFLMESRGVKLHWMTNAKDEWTCIEADNSISEPLNRRGPRSLALKSGDWNAASIQILDGKVLVTLNGQEVYERSLDDLQGRHFGLYHDRRQSAARVRNVKLTGDWPDKLSLEDMGDLIAFD